MSYTNYTLSTSNLLRRVYGWMAAGLTITSLVSFYTFQSGLFIKIVHHPVLFWGLMIAQLACVFFLSFMATKMDFATAATTFLLYSGLTGLSLSVVFAVYTMSSVALTFFVTAALFGSMAAYGYLTRTDLSSLSSFLFMGLIGLIIAGIVNLFIGSSTFELVISAFGVVLFTLLTAYDVQMIKRLSYEVGDHENAGNIAIIGALKLYLDAINLFLHLLKILGQRRER